MLPTDDSHDQTMLSVGVKEFKAKASQLLRQVREHGTVIEITYRGRPFARLVPVAQPLDLAQVEAIMADLDQLAAEISRKWPEGVSAVDAIHDVRRDL